MKSLRAVSAFRELRGQPLWELLAALKAPVIAGVLRTLLFDSDKSLQATVLYERLTRELEALRADGEDMPQTAQAYVAEWLRNGWLSRRLPQGASEEVYELTAEASDAIRFLNATLKPRTVATESRLATVMQQLSRLAEETDANPATRVAALENERDRIERDIAAVRRGEFRTLPKDRALERAREIIQLADELTGDFRRVRDDFDKLNRSLRQSLMEHDGNRRDVLEALFAGVDVISESDAGKTFSAFWGLLTDHEQSGALLEALEAVTTREFARDLEPRERKFLMNLTMTLMDEGSGVHDVLQNFARSLKTFVQSREFREQRRMHQLLKAATQAALAVKDNVRTSLLLPYELELTSTRIRSLSQWVLHDPAERVVDARVLKAEDSTLTLEAVGELVRQSEIDFRTLKLHIREMLHSRSQVSIQDLLDTYPAEQGLGSVLGYVALGAKHGERTAGVLHVRWTGKDDVERRARVPALYFIKERYVELVD